MKLFTKPYLIFFAFSLLFYVLFDGLYTTYLIYYRPYFDNSYEWYHFSQKNYIPSKTELIFSGFRSLPIFINGLLTTTALIITAEKLNVFDKSRKIFLNSLYTAIVLTILFTALYAISTFIWYKWFANFTTSFCAEILKGQLPFFAILYFIGILPITVILKKKIN